MDVVVLFTCHNRENMTRKSVYSLDDSSLSMQYIAVNDGCTDGTAAMLDQFGKDKDRGITILKGDGSLYWAGGMRKAMKYLRDKEVSADYVLLINDDVEFVDGALNYMLKEIKKHSKSCIVGATRDDNGKTTYGGIRYDMKRVKDTGIDVNDSNLKCDVANMNAFLIPYDAFKKAGVFDKHYKHAMADYDYSFELRRQGYHIFMTGKYVGVCPQNSRRGTWQDTRLSRRERVKLKESPKGLPAKEWFYYLKKNFGIRQAIWHSITPYIRIAIRQ